MAKYCCEEFKDALNPEGRYPVIEKNLMANCYAINGCCGGGCWVIDRIAYCPFCGSKLNG